MATIIFLSLPPQTFLGVDLISFNTSANFHGLSNLPPGLHFIYTGTDAALSIRHGTWLTVSTASTSPGPLYIFKWTAEEEQLLLLTDSDDDFQRTRRNLPELLARGVLDYSALRNNAATDSNDSWPTLTRYITPSTLTRTLGSAHSLTSLSSTIQDAAAEHIPGLTQAETQSQLADSSTLNLISIDLKRTWPEHAIGKQRTDMARDRSWYLSHLFSRLQTENQMNQNQAAREIFAELQLCYISVLTLSNYSCMEQWKRILGVVFTCKLAVEQGEGFFVEVVRVLMTQLKRVEDVEGGLFDLGDEMGSAWLRKLLRAFRGNLDEIEADKVKAEMGLLDQWSEEQYGWNEERGLRRTTVQLDDGEEVEAIDERWDEEDDEGEYAPVVVET